MHSTLELRLNSHLWESAIKFMLSLPDQLQFHEGLELNSRILRVLFPLCHQMALVSTCPFESIYSDSIYTRWRSGHFPLRLAPSQCVLTHSLLTAGAQESLRNSSVLSSGNTINYIMTTFLCSVELYTPNAAILSQIQNSTQIQAELGFILPT